MPLVVVDSVLFEEEWYVFPTVVGALYMLCLAELYLVLGNAPDGVRGRV